MKKIDKSLVSCINCKHRGGIFDDYDCKILDSRIDAAKCSHFDLVKYSTSDVQKTCANCTDDCSDCQYATWTY